jgi:beta-phosphoglucomutase
MQYYEAFLFDLNGTMIMDMDYHVKAWHKILFDLGIPITIEKMKQECYGKNEELLERISPGRFTRAEKNKLCFAKELAYQSNYRPYLKLIEGLDDFMTIAKRHYIKMAIGTAAVMSNVDFVVDGCNIRSLIDIIISADDVKSSKPHPETYLLCAEKLNVVAEKCLVFEDVPSGVEAAANAGMDCLVITSSHTQSEFSNYSNIIGFIKDYTDPLLYKLF